MSMPRQCPSCGGFCGGGKGKSCQYGRGDKDSTDKWIEAIIVVLRGELKSQAKAHKAELDAAVEQAKQNDNELLKLIYDDLKMRSVEGVIDISNFIWMRLSERVNAGKEDS